MLQLLDDLESLKTTAFIRLCLLLVGNEVQLTLRGAANSISPSSEQPRECGQREDNKVFGTAHRSKRLDQI